MTQKSPTFEKSITGLVSTGDAAVLVSVAEPGPLLLHSAPATPEPRAGLVAAAILAFCTALFAISLTGLPQFMDNEWRLSAYVLDILQNGRWLCPTDANGDIISKPPMLAWLAAFGVIIAGHVNAFALYWPTAVATTATASLLFVYGRKYFGWRAGLFASMAYAVSYVGLSQTSMPRYDGLLALPVTAAAFAAFTAWQTGRGWTWFWFFAALGTLVKGPIAVILPAFGLLAVFRERRNGRLPGVVAALQLPGVLLFLLIIGGWFALAYAEAGQPLLDKMLGRELLGHAVRDRGGPFSGIAEPTKAFLGIYAPWSVIAVIGFWRVIRSPSNDPIQRRLERFLLLWFSCGLILLSVAAHQRGRLMYPLIPAAAMVAGLQMSRWTTATRTKPLLVAAAAVAAMFLAGSWFYTHVLVAQNRRVQETLAMQALAERLKTVRTNELSLIHVHSPSSLQVWLNTRRAELGPQAAAAFLARAEPVFVITKDAASIRAAVPTNALLYEVYSWSVRGSSVQILSNRREIQ